MIVLAVNGRFVTLSTGETVRWPASSILPAVGQVVFASDLEPPTPWGLMTMATRVPGHQQRTSHHGGRR